MKSKLFRICIEIRFVLQIVVENGFFLDDSQWNGNQMGIQFTWLFSGSIIVGDDDNDR